MADLVARVAGLGLAHDGSGDDGGLAVACKAVNEEKREEYRVSV